MLFVKTKDPYLLTGLNLKPQAGQKSLHVVDVGIQEMISRTQVIEFPDLGSSRFFSVFRLLAGKEKVD